MASSGMLATVERESIVSETEHLEFVVAAYPVLAGSVALVHHRALDRWLPPGGHIRPGETPDDAAIREVREELGLAVQLVDEDGPDPRSWTDGVLLLKRPITMRREVIDSAHHHVDLVYAAVAEDGLLHPNEEELIAAQWFSSDALKRDCISPDVRAAAHRAIEVVELCLKRTR